MRSLDEEVSVTLLLELLLTAGTAHVVWIAGEFFWRISLIFQTQTNRSDILQNRTDYM